MIVFNTNQLNHFSAQYKSQQNTNQFNLPLTAKDKQINHVSLPSNTLTLLPQSNNISETIAKEHPPQENNYYNQQFSLLARFAIEEYQALTNIEIQQTKSLMFGINEFA